MHGIRCIARNYAYGTGAFVRAPVHRGLTDDDARRVRLHTRLSREKERQVRDVPTLAVRRHLQRDSQHRRELSSPASPSPFAARLRSPLSRPFELVAFSFSLSAIHGDLPVRRFRFSRVRPTFSRSSSSSRARRILRPSRACFFSTAKPSPTSESLSRERVRSFSLSL